ncbi:phosphoribosylanthranilate isomerase [Echinicola sediminis]
MLVKVCGMREPANVQALLEEVSPDLMGMIFYSKSSRFVQGDSSVLASGKVAKVGVFVNASLSEVLETVEAFKLSYVQLHGDENSAYVKELHSKTRAEIIKVFRVKKDIDWEELRVFEPYVKYFLFDTQTKHFGGSGKKFDWSVLETYPLQKPFLLSGGIDENSVVAIRQLEKKVPLMAGIDINSKFELEPALKDVAKIRTFVSALRAS